ncbi:MAG: imidazolonepropionase [Prolixibacteraceae bacterium]|jgi:imidazolonepropionase|nr:imidazolonepropionase [Prolixibacteraceae bacterium]
MKLIGPFKQLITMDKLPLKGPLNDDLLEVIEHAGILINNSSIKAIGDYEFLKSKFDGQSLDLDFIDEELVAFPGFIDAHTHICWAGSRANDYAKRLSGKTYLEIANEGGGIWSTVQKTRELSQHELQTITEIRANQLLKDGVTTAEVKSGYGLSVESELKMLRAINNAFTEVDLIPTCLAAHICPKDFEGTTKEYLNQIRIELLPIVKTEKLSNRVDIFIEDSAFSVSDAREYLREVKDLGFDIVIHGDQFSVGGSQLAIEMNAVSVDHLEASDMAAIENIAHSNVIATVLPGASIGLGIPFAPARKLLDAGACLAIASDWNPGSAPNGDLFMQASILGVYEKLTIAETLAGITSRSAAALKLNDRGILKKGNIADIVAFKTNDYREVIYRQGKLKPEKVWKKGKAL